MVLTKLLESFEKTGDEAKLAIIKQVSPVAWHNINLNGNYSFDFDHKLIDIEELMRPITDYEPLLKK
jgi:hypothetical protein